MWERNILKRSAAGRRLFVDDLRAARPDVDLSRVYSPNIKSDIVRRSRTAGVGRAEQSCACQFIDRHADAIRHMGGFRSG